MKDFLILVGKVALGVFIVGTLILGPDDTSMKSQINNSNTHNAANMSAASTW